MKTIHLIVVSLFCLSILTFICGVLGVVLLSLILGHDIFAKDVEVSIRIFFTGAIFSALLLLPARYSAERLSE